ncbi:uncharacterized protein LOC129591353 [Paramacrobiotus metropolitanus]|uniref:uncharacterized protein LOC129591353 n=1 Tax=Paramacrobiotus metropolitanus TaxID=2943436 RepID=UPI002445BEFA|nr:uncharacterized protein LOC129591353 [Paramacrobiotus metropolitanus]XP_055342956.1 uncharacterized protein LOC129591353 [Paramacrobiotus metropolitanus]XP_055342957.1 uncharacterized protein LOC129591353 [Paramacrobiotus metropolitanus]XP_055342958.1 uncharacterized protein LOC129591353 [Paramacrobiotus metropolitanus]XP_055342959.1 uncharacterized protein LOC129591353 [Paramacrobiotus metropolitanus]XP_055342960.1 uncharacterized protein LOC129591353 [Paramacrobiotus metropolitanus]XP_05
MSGSSVASDSFSSVQSSSCSGTTSPDRDSHASSLNYSHAQWERSNTGNSPLTLESLAETLSAEEVTQIETFYRGLFSQVYVCPAGAALYLCEPEMTTRQTPASWILQYAEGVPVVVQVTRPDRKSVHFIFAERGTGFPLWRDVITKTSDYRSVDADYHDFKASNQKTRVGLRIASTSAASKFLQNVITLISNPANFQEMKMKRTPKKKNPPPKKSSISPPCCFAHLVHVAKDDDLTSLSQFVTPLVNNNGPVQTHLANPRASVMFPSKVLNGSAAKRS